MTQYSRTSRPSMLTRLRARAKGGRAGPTTTTTTTTTTTRRSHARKPMFGRRRRAPVAARGHHTTAAHPAPVHHHRRRPSMGDKISGAMMKLRGSLTRRPGLKAAGTRRMHGTDGRGARRHY